jgi:RHS repeat-associated protein
MTNWSSFPAGGPRVTTWNYNQYRGWLESKDYPNATTGAPAGTPGTNGPQYAYTSGGRLKARTWLRTYTGSNKIVTTYTYGFEQTGEDDKHGDIVAINHNDGTTPPTTKTYDLLGRLQTVQNNGIETTLGYNNAQILTESYSGGTLDGLSVTNGYDHLLRRTNVVGLYNGSSVLNWSEYWYGSASPLVGVSESPTYNQQAVTVTYGYRANSPLVSQLGFASGTTQMTVNKQYDKLNRLTSISAAPGSGVRSSYTYVYNDANQRIQSTLEDGSYWVYQYDALGQVIDGRKYWADGTAVLGQQFDYAFDQIGNRVGSHIGTRASSYSANRMNQYANRSVSPRGVDVTGLTLATEAVTVNSAATSRQGEYFHKELTYSSSSTPRWEAINVAAAGETPISGNVFIPGSPESFTYDADGNLKSDGRWNYTWDSENRLIRMVARTTVGPQQRLDFEYDWQGRRIGKKVWNNVSGTGDPVVNMRFLYDGWNLLAEVNTSGAAVRSYLWGSDLSGSLNGAGGVGGLLAVRDTTEGVHFVGYDGNGNVAILLKPATGKQTRYEYAPFGEVIRATGPMAKVNPFRFSTKYQDDESDLVYYGYRYYSASTGRWISRDPKGEAGGLHLYGFNKNSPVLHLDPLGLDSQSINIPLGFSILGLQTGSWKGQWIWSCVKDHEDSDIDPTPGFTGWAGNWIGVGIKTPGDVSIGVGGFETAHPVNLSVWKECARGCGISYHISLKVTIKQNATLILGGAWVLAEEKFEMDCPCKENK